MTPDNKKQGEGTAPSRPLAWKEWDTAVPVSIEERDRWAAKILASADKGEDGRILSTQSGDSMVFIHWGEEGDEFVRIFDVCVRRTAFVSLRAPQGEARSEVPS